MAEVCSKVLLIEPPLIYTAPDTCVFGAVPVDGLCVIASNLFRR